MKISFLNTWLQKISDYLYLKWHLACFRFYLTVGKDERALKHLHSIPLSESETDDFDSFFHEEQKIWHKYKDKDGVLRIITFKRSLLFLLKTCLVIFMFYILILTLFKREKFFNEIALSYDKGKSLIGAVKEEIKALDDTKQFILKDGNDVTVSLTMNPMLEKNRFLIPTKNAKEGKDSTICIPIEKFVGKSFPFGENTYIRSFVNMKNDTTYFILSPDYSIKRGQIKQGMFQLLNNLTSPKKKIYEETNELVTLTITSDITVRDKPTNEGDPLGTLSAGKEVQFLQFGPISSDKVWIYVNYKDSTEKSIKGWITAYSIKEQFVEKVE